MVASGVRLIIKSQGTRLSFQHYEYAKLDLMFTKSNLSLCFSDPLFPSQEPRSMPALATGYLYTPDPTALNADTGLSDRWD